MGHQLGRGWLHQDGTQCRQLLWQVWHRDGSLIPHQDQPKPHEIRVEDNDYTRSPRRVCSGCSELREEEELEERWEALFSCFSNPYLVIVFLDNPFLLGLKL